jgi:hypothetical protein
MTAKSRIFALFAVLGVFLAGCDRQQVMRWFASQDEAAIGRQYVEEIRDRNFTPIDKDLAPSVQVPEPALMQLAAFLNANETPRSVTLVTNDSRSDGNTTVYALGYEYEFSRDWRLIELYLTRTNGVTKISGLRTYALSESLQQVNGFNFRYKTSRHFAFLAMALLVILFTLATAFVCWRTPMRGKWPWLLFIILGLGEIGLSWTSGAIYYDLLALEPFGAGFTRDLAGAYFVQIGLPLGAILFWVFRGKLKSRN